MTPPLRVLIIEDSEDDTALMLRVLQQGGYIPTYQRVDTSAGMLAALEQQEWDVVICDYNLPQFSAPAALQLLKQTGLDLPFIVVSGTIGEDVAVTAMKLGAHDYLMKGNLKRLVPAVERELREAEERRQRRRAEQAFRDGEKRFRSLIENALDIIAVLDTKGRVQYISPSVVQVLGYRPEGAVGLNIFYLLHPDDVQRVQIGIKQALQNPEQTITLEVQLRDYKGAWRILEATGKAFQEVDGSTSIIVNSRDLSDRKQAEEIRKAWEKEKELNELKSQFVSMVSHEFRTPLTTILMSIHLLEKYSDHTTPEKRQQYFDRIHIAANHMTQLLDEILILGKAEAEKVEFKPAPLDLVQLCREVVEETQLTTAHHHTIRFKCPFDHLPARMDGALLWHILTNLLSNAVKYSPHHPTVEFELIPEPRHTPQRVIFQIQDHGIGIPEADQHHLFASFQRGSNVGKIAGTGLGLAIVKQFVELHRGTIDFKSKVGSGTTFIVRLPLHSLS